MSSRGNKMNVNVLNIYDSFNYKQLLKIANLHFNGCYKWYNAKTVFAPRDGTYTVSINKWCVRVCYWYEDTPDGEKAKESLKEFIDEVLKENTATVVCNSSKCDLVNDFYFVQQHTLG